MNRELVVCEIAKKNIYDLSDKERSEILMSMWYMVDQQDMDEGFDISLIEFDFNIIEYFINNEFDENKIYGSFFDPAIIYFISRQYLIFNNSKLKKMYFDIYGTEIQIDEDSRKNLFKCKCCGFYSLSSESEYEICGVCFWEDDGQIENKYSSVNRSTMSEFRKAFYERKSKSELEKNYISDNSI